MSSDRSSNDLLGTVRVSFIYSCQSSKEAVQIVHFSSQYSMLVLYICVGKLKKYKIVHTYIHSVPNFSTFHIAFETNNIAELISNIRQNYL
jgi:hypothetical protein